MSNDMDRRGFLASVSVGLSLFVGGCNTLNDPNSGEKGIEDFEPAQRLGAAGKISVKEPLEIRYTPSSGLTFAEKATMEAAYHASLRVQEILENQSLFGENISRGVGEVDLEAIETTEASRPTESEFKRASDTCPFVGYEYRYSRDGELLSKPSVGFDTIVEATPRSISVTVTYSDREYNAVLPVLCERMAIKQA